MREQFDFSFDSYDRLLRIFQTEDYKNGGYFDSPKPKKHLILRHDIDIDIHNCAELSHIELSHGYSSTWFFQPNNDYYNPLSTKCVHILRDLSEHHTLGLHIDPSIFPDLNQLQQGIQKLYDFYSCYFDVKKVFSFHRPAKYLTDSSIYVDGFINAYDKRFMDITTYVSDSNRRAFFTQDRIWDAVDNGDSVILLTHPLWWHETSLEPDQLYKHLCASAQKNLCQSALAENITLYSSLADDA